MGRLKKIVILASVSSCGLQSTTKELIFTVGTKTTPLERQTASTRNYAGHKVGRSNAKLQGPLILNYDGTYK